MDGPQTRNRMAFGNLTNVCIKVGMTCVICFLVGETETSYQKGRAKR